MKSLILRIWYSITARLVVLFLLIGGCGFILFLTLFRLYSASVVPSTPYPVQFLSYLSEQLPEKITLTQVNELMAQTVYSLRVEEGHKSWQTDAAIPPFSKLKKQRMVNDRVGYFSSKTQTAYLVLTTNERRFIFGHRFAHADDNGYRLIVMLIPLLALLLLMLGYFIAGRFFIPISWIRKGALRIGEGDLSYRIPYRRNDELGQLVAIINQMAEDLERIFDSKRQLLLAISHELRSPLTRMKLNLALLDESKISLRLGDDIDDMRSIVEGLLDSERLQGQHKALEKTQVKPVQLINDIVKEYPSSAGLKLNCDIELETMWMDVAKIRFLLRNLVNNALKYTDANDREVSIDVKTQEGLLYITVTDNGCGIDEEHQAHIFSPFYRADKSRGRQTGGVGLGLYLCLLIAKAHTGDIQVKSKLGQGSCFVATLPIETKGQ